ncbi:autotransporter family protein [Fusobacterium ulcerans]|uniref:Autotransporter domain-containing protein n=1 Tax=Fusobacterium ulcerans 12-1B TaxID=457404 RepID=H1PWP9_9FUSO|nr:autotransporter outer membrane beta-barrel domain-containing protein [Fusobacterium ulcerans]EHO79101.2 hypothetical protein HMPREF0402_02842 [Fusobacterium ulcerans 12-1B]
MIEKILKAVKSSSKKRGRNITVGAVVGFLLSCTAVMGADENYLLIKKEGEEIKFSKNGTTAGTDNPYEENTWDGTEYVNNIALNSTSNYYGVKLEGDLGNVNFTNNGLITTTRNSESFGINNSLYATIGNITNNGSITAESTGDAIAGNGIKNARTITNNGSINGSTKARDAGDNCFGVGIYNSETMGDITNNGSITAESTGENSLGYGINNLKYSEVKIKTIDKIRNIGVIYGKTNAIYNSNGTMIKEANNYGLLVSGDSTENVVDGISIVAHDAADNDDEIKNYELAFTVDSNKYIGGGKSSSSEINPDIDYYNNFGKIHQNVSIDGVSYDIINVDAKVDDTSKEITDWKSLTLEEGKLTYYDSREASDKEESISPDKKYILNGIENTLKISGRKNELNNSVVNAYETAVVMGEDNSILTLNNTVVNGGIKADTTTISITKNGSALTVKGDSVINVRKKGTAIKVTGSDNAVVLEGNAIVNGKMEASGERNILDLNGTGKYGMNIHYDISGFEKMAIDNNVTFFEDMKVTGTNEVTVEGTGVLNLRLKKDSTTTYGTDTPPKATHAFSENGEMTIIGNSPDEAGTLNFITNGIGRVIDVDMENIKLENMKIKASSIIDKAEIHEDFIRLGAGSDLSGIVNPKVNKYNSLNKIYKSIYSSREENLDGLRDILSLSTYLGKNYDYNNRIEAEKEEQLASLLGYLTSIYIESPYSYSSELSRRSMGMFRDIVTENEFRPNLNKWMIMGGLTHADGGTKDTYYGQNYHEIDGGTAETSADIKLTGAYMLAKYGYSENLSLGVTLGGNKSEAEMSMSKVKGNSGYLGAFAENYRGNLTLKAGTGIQYSEYDTDRRTLGNAYSDKYSDMAYDIYLNGRYSHQVGDNLFLEPYATLSYIYIDQDGADEGSKVLAIETDSKSFDYTAAKVGVDLKKVIPHEKGKSTLSAGVSYTKILDGADEEHITGRFKGGSDFDILVAHKNEHSIGLNAKYALELENGVLFDVKGTYSVERDSNNNSGKNKTKGEWIVGAGIGYKF